ncbi:MAG: GNAT family N-acetyltransferase [Ruminococcus sp.]|nr:GNAT family N-acetyltransferase [Selenomonadaceae bacterium]MBQ7505003.1 GNAT family N-acetyltransferase [Ruminococcus sp.]
MNIRPMTIEDYDEVYAMWQITSKRALSAADSRENIERYLSRNPNMSMVAVCDGKIVGTVLAGHDGRTGFIHHTAVHPDYRRRHIGKALVQKAVEQITENGINKTQIYCYKDNSTGQSFWQSMGFNRTDNILFEKRD